MADRTARLAPFATLTAIGALTLAGTALGQQLRGGYSMPPAQQQAGPIANVEPSLPPALDAPKPLPHEGPIVQLAVLLDTSNSMDGLIDQARSEIWTVVNRLRTLRHESGEVQLQVALYQYGNSGLESADGYTQLRVPMTTDLDTIGAQLFALSTNGGSEFCGYAIREASDVLEWTAQSADSAPMLRMIVVAGNEPFSQGMVSYHKAIPDAAEKGIRIHTVHCGSEAEGRSTFWEAGAALGGGFYFAIDQNEVIEYSTKYDGEIMSLNEALNGTYLRYGSKGADAEKLQSEVDKLNSIRGNQAASRAFSKGSSLYGNAHWDLVDASAQEGFDLEKVDRETLPEDLQELTLEELRAKIEEARAERTEIRARLTELSVLYAQEVQRLRLGPDAQTLGSALADAIIDQAIAEGFTVEEPEVREPDGEAEPEPAPEPVDGEDDGEG